MRPLVILLMSLAACAVVEEAGPAPWADFDPFARPVSYTVKRGDTLAKIAVAQGVSVDDLRGWNGIEGDLIEVDQTLLIWAPDPSARTVRTRTPRTSPRTSPHIVTSIAPAVVVIAPPPPRPAMPHLVRNAGVLGAMEGESLSTDMDPTLVDSIAGLSVRETSTTSSGLEAGRRADFASGTAEESAAIGRIGTHPTESRLTTAPVRAPRLATPAPKRCLAGPSGSDLDADYGMVAAVGLSERQIRDVLDPFVRHTAACVPAGSTGGLTVTTEITVGCDGRVSGVDIVGTGGAPSAVTACIAETLSKAGFPAHDLPDGLTFAYPISYRF